MASDATTDSDRALHSLHSTFLRPGNPKIPLELTVERIRDGIAFSTRRVDIHQQGKLIFTANANYHISETGDHHELDPEWIPTLPASFESLKVDDIVDEEIDRPAKGNFTELFCFNRHTITKRLKAPQSPAQVAWFTCTGALRVDSRLHRAAIALISDYALLSTAFLPHPTIAFHDEYTAASLDHSIWFHSDARADEPLLYYSDSPWSGHARGFSRGQMRTQSGKLICSTAQENLMRKH